LSNQCFCVNGCYTQVNANEEESKVMLQLIKVRIILIFISLLITNCQQAQDTSATKAEITPNGVSGIWDRCPDVAKASNGDETDINFDNYGCPGDDSDGDGISDDWDSCPDTAPGVAVDDSGCATIYYYYGTFTVRTTGKLPDFAHYSGDAYHGTGIQLSPTDAQTEMERRSAALLESCISEMYTCSIEDKKLVRLAPDDLCGEALCLAATSSDTIGGKVGLKVSSSDEEDDLGRITIGAGSPDGSQGTGEPGQGATNGGQAIEEGRYTFETPYQSINGQKLARTARLGENASKQVQAKMPAGGYPAHRMAYSLLNFGQNALSHADQAYMAGNQLLGDDTILLSVMAFEVVIDLATSFTPGISWGRDLYEAVTGFDAITREELSSFARGASIIGVVTGGVFSGIKNIPRVIERIGNVLKRSNMNGGDAVSGAIRGAEQLFDSAKSHKIDLRKLDTDRFKNNPLTEKKYTDKVKGQMQSDQFHGFPDVVDNFAGLGKKVEITGGDGIKRTKIELEGEYLGRKGNFEWIIEPDGAINHRKFEPLR